LLEMMHTFVESSAREVPSNAFKRGTLMKLTAKNGVEEFNQTHIDEFLENYQLKYRERLDRMLASDPISFVNV
jgi:hypothetical protein